MGLLDLIRRLMGFDSGPDIGRDLPELARRLDMTDEALAALTPRYRTFEIAKSGGGRRTLAAPEDDLKAVQRAIMRKLLRPLPVHPAAHGFVKGRSIKTATAPHVGRAVLVQLDVTEFFATTRADRVEALWRALGWNRAASRRLTELTTHRRGLPQGAPTSPALANVVNVVLDRRLAGLATSRGAAYTRYADDLLFSLAVDDRAARSALIRGTKQILADTGYTLHQGRKLRIRRPHQQQRALGLVLNERQQLPRATRRWLRAVAHRMETGGEATLTPDQLAGWAAFQRMLAD